MANLKVARRDKNAGSEDGRYSAVGDRGGAGVDDENLKGSTFRVREAARSRMAVRWGVRFESTSRFFAGVAALLPKK